MSGSGASVTENLEFTMARESFSSPVLRSSLGPRTTAFGPLTHSPVSLTSLTPTATSYLPLPSQTPSLTPSPLSSSTSPTSPTMAVATIVYLIGIPVILCLLLAILITLIICIICCWQQRRKTRHPNKSERSRNRGRSNQSNSSKSLEAYSGNGHGPHTAKDKETEDSKRYELRTMGGGREGSPRASNTLPAASRTTHSNAAWSSNPYIYTGSGQTPSPFHEAGSGSPRSYTSPIHVQIPSPHLKKIPEGGMGQKQDEHYVAMIGSKAKVSTLPHSFPDCTSSGISDPTSHYDVPPGTGGSILNPYNPQGTYDVPKSALIATGHYKVPPLMGHGSIEGIYDVPPPSSGAIYDVPPSNNYSYNPASELYDVPPLSRPRLNSQPTSQDELQEARRSVINAAGAGSPFAGSAVPSHYDVPRHLLFSEPDVSHYQQPQGKRLSRRNSNPSQPPQSRVSEIYDVPRDAKVAPPPTAAKPLRKPPSRSHSIGSPHNVASPERRRYPNEVFYDVPPLDPEFLAQHLKQQVPTPSESSHGTRSSTSSGTTNNSVLSPSRSQSAKKAKVPPPTRRKPERRRDSEDK